MQIECNKACFKLQRCSLSYAKDMNAMKQIVILTLTLVFALTLKADNAKLYQVGDKLSSSLIDCVVQDNYGYIWIGTEYGLNKFDGYRFTNYMMDVNDTTSICSNEITTILVDRKGRLWIGSDRGLSLYSYVTNAFRRYLFPDGVSPRVESMAQNSDGDILIGTAGYGMFAIKSGEDRIIKLQEFTRNNVDEFVKKVFVDDQQNLWKSHNAPSVVRTKINNLKPTSFRDFNLDKGPVVSFLRQGKSGFLIVCMYGILRYDYATATIKDAGYDLSAIDKRVSIRKAMFDHLGNLYIGTSGCGVMMIPRGDNKPVQVESNTMRFDLSTANVNDLLEDKDHNIWVSCYRKGLYEMNQEKRAFATWSFSSQNFRLGSSVSSITSGNNGDIWCTVQKSGVYHFAPDGKIVSKQTSPDGANVIYKDHAGQYWLGTENALYKYNPDSGASEKCLTFDGWGVNCITDDGDGTLFISNYGKGLTIYNTHTGDVKSFNMHQTNKTKGALCNDWIKTFYLDSRDLLWIGCADGLSCMNPADGNFKIFGWNTLLPRVQCNAILEKDDGNMLIGTGAGLYEFDRKHNKLTAVSSLAEIRNTTVLNMMIDKSGDLWLTTTNGLWQLDHKQNRLLSHINGNGLESNEYVTGAMVYAKDDRLFFGTNDGVVTFYPKDVKESGMQMDTVFLTNFVVNGKTVNCHQDRFVIPYEDNTFSMEFSLLTYRNTENITFQYRINGSSHWISITEGTNVVSFNKMNPGKYVVEVRAMCNGNYSRYTRKITVIVKDPWYSSVWAYLLYVLLGVGLVAFLMRQYDRRRKEELEEAKMRFLINATHDIRSPLTLILGPLKKLKQQLANIEDGGTRKEMEYDIDTIDRNAQRLLLLVNQILDERKIDKNQMRLHCRETELVAYVNGVCAMFNNNARQRDILLKVESSQPEINVWIDRSNFDKVLSNLLSNAFKYTPDGGEITFNLYCDSKYANIELTDTGIGFKNDKTDVLFNRFVQGSNAEDLHIEGTGIGLNLSRSIVKMHGGKIQAYNRKDGIQGACLHVSIPMGKDHLKAEEIVADEKRELRQKAERQNASRGMRIMVVDDDPEITHYIESELSKWYHIDLFSNGKDALNALLTDDFNLVISDVIMPEMDGVTLLKNIKKNTKISDIPVILLTTKTEINDRLLGLKQGADAYVSKPFNMDELHVLIDNLINNVRRLRGKFSGAQAQEEKVENIEVKGNDDALMERIMRSINEHIGDSEYNVENLTTDVGISRAQLHRRMKEMTGISTGEFIRNLRLEQAARLIKENKINITQVAYSVGFNNQSHFSTVFRKHFGMTPSEYAHKFREKEET